MKKIRMTLSTSSIKDAIRQLEEHKRELSFKTMLFVQRLGEVGLRTVEAHKQSRGDSDFNDLEAHVELERISDMSVKAKLILHGKDVAFIEFGAGVHYNGTGGSSPNPYGQSLGMIIGSYGKGYGLDDSWIYYDEESGRFKTSYGTEAAMPMYLADVEIRRQFIEVAKEVFGNG